MKFFMLTLLTFLLATKSFAWNPQDPSEEALQAINSTQKWNENLDVYDLEMVSIDIFGGSTSESSTEQKTILREVYDKKSHRFCLGMSAGTWHLNLDTGQSTDNSTHFVVFGSLFEALRKTDGFASRKVKHQEGHLPEVSRGFAFSLYPLVFNIPDKDGKLAAEELDFLIAGLAERKCDVHASSEEFMVLGKKRKVRYVRIARKLNAPQTGGSIRIGNDLIIAEDGFDKGLVLGMRMVILKDEGATYEKEEEVAQVIRNALVEWKQVSLQGKSVVVLSDVDKRLFLTGGENSHHLKSHFEWKPIDNVEEMLQADKFESAMATQKAKLHKMLSR